MTTRINLRDKIKTDSLVDADEEFRTIKVEFPLSHDTDVMLVFTGKKVQRNDFPRLHSIVDLIEASMYGLPPKEATIVEREKVIERIIEKQIPVTVPPEPVSQVRKGKKRGPKPKGEQRFRVAKERRYHPPDPQRRQMIIDEYIKDGGKRTMYKLANDIQVPYTTLTATVNAAKKKGLIPVVQEGGINEEPSIVAGDSAGNNGTREGIMSGHPGSVEK